MNVATTLVAFILCTGITPPTQAAADILPNPLIDYQGFLRDAVTVEKLRAERRISEEEFLQIVADPATIILDARSQEKYRLLHVRGAKNLSLPDITADELARLIPSKATRVLIYCNNNFVNEPRALPAKEFRASLNIYTFNALFSYGYENVYELGPLVDSEKTRLPLVGSLRPPAKK